jgi:hypothetical protein
MDSTLFSSLRMRIAAFQQKPNEVFKRDPGQHALHGPFPVKPEAHDDWQFALLSVAAYGRSEPKRHSIPISVEPVAAVRHMWEQRKVSRHQPQNVDAELEAIGWIRWSDFPDPALEEHMAESHLRAEVWEHKEQKKIVVAFGGTVFTSGKDWASNLRWFIPKKKDEYTDIVLRFGPDFVAAFKKLVEAPDTAYMKDVTVYSTGHSLGGGLAQQFAYAMPIVEGGPRVSEVFAFDPSPVTGFYNVDVATRDHNRTGLKIARIYERGEILAILRSLTSLIFKPSVSNPEVRGVRFSLFYSLDFIRDHSMQRLASKMREAAGE